MPLSAYQGLSLKRAGFITTSVLAKLHVRVIANNQILSGETSSPNVLGVSLCLIVSYHPSLFAHHSSEYRRGIRYSSNHGNTIKLSATRDSSDGSSVSDKLSFRASIDPCDAEPPYTESPEGPLPPASSSSLPSFAPPPFSSLYFPPPASPDRLEASITEPLSDPPPAFSPVRPAEAAVAGTTSVEAETKAALPADNKGESSKSAEESEPPPPYTEGSSPLDSFTYVMAAAGGAASIITQVQQGGPAPVNTLAGTNMKMMPISCGYYIVC